MEISEGVAALWAAGIGVAASAVASVITSRAARQQAEVGARAQIEAVKIQASEAHSQEKKRRQQRVYADFHTAANTLRAACVDAELTLNSISDDADPSELEEADATFSGRETEMLDRTRDFWHSYAAIGLEGPDSVDDAAESLFGTYDLWVKCIIEWASQILQENIRDSAKEEEFYVRCSAIEETVKSETVEFLNEAQAVLS
ncbi:hypothetical protein [Streptomyces umbrinus]|uniref:hypothetical protein n=1 Tax=Streptomyces umbrinus TaxID=67370 RepID=UPI003C2E33CB